MTISSKPGLNITDCLNKRVGGFISNKFDADGTSGTAEENVEPNEVKKCADAERDEIVGKGMS